MPPEETPSGMITLGPEDVTIAIPNLKKDKPATAQVTTKPPPAETPTGNVTLGPEDMTIAIPRIFVVPRGDVRVGYRPFDLELLGIARLQPVPENVLLQSLRTNERRSIFADQHLTEEQRQALMRIYLSFRHENADEVGPGHGPGPVSPGAGPNAPGEPAAATAAG